MDYGEDYGESDHFIISLLPKFSTFTNTLLYQGMATNKLHFKPCLKFSNCVYSFREQ